MFAPRGPNEKQTLAIILLILRSGMSDMPRKLVFIIHAVIYASSALGSSRRAPANDCKRTQSQITFNNRFRVLIGRSESRVCGPDREWANLCASTREREPERQRKTMPFDMFGDGINNNNHDALRIGSSANEERRTKRA